MKGEKQYFRKRFIGGFNRDDVIKYIKKITDERNESLAAKEKAENEAAELRTQIDELKSQNFIAAGTISPDVSPALDELPVLDESPVHIAETVTPDIPPIPVLEPIPVFEPVPVPIVGEIQEVPAYNPVPQPAVVEPYDLITGTAVPGISPIPVMEPPTHVVATVTPVAEPASVAAAAAPAPEPARVVKNIKQTNKAPLRVVVRRRR